MNGLNQTLHIRNGSTGTSCRLSTFLGSIRCCKMSTFTLSRCGEAAVAGLVHHETSKVARRVSCGRPEAWHASRFSAHIASAPLCRLGPEMGWPDRSPSLACITGAVSRYLKIQRRGSNFHRKSEALRRRSTRHPTNAHLLSNRATCAVSSQAL